MPAEVASDLGATDGSSIAEAAKLAVIGREMGIYPYFDAYMLSFLIEPLDQCGHGPWGGTPSGRDRIRKSQEESRRAS